MSKAEELASLPPGVWPDELMLRDTGIHDDLGGGGQRIYTTAGNGYPKVCYVRAAHLRALDASHRQLLEALEALVLADDAKQYNHLLKGIGTNTPIGKRWANAESAIAAAKELT